MAKVSVRLPLVQLITVILAFVVTLGASPTSDALSNAKIDLAIIAPGSTSKSHTKAFREMMQNLPNHIVMAEDKVRVAVVQPINSISKDVKAAQILFNLSSNAEKLKEWATNWESTSWKSFWFHHAEAFSLIRQHVFNFRGSESTKRAKLVIQVLDGWPFNEYRAEAVEEAKKLRQEGAIIYVNVPEEKTFGELPNLIDVAKQYAGLEFFWRSQSRSQWLDPWNIQQSVLMRLFRDLCLFCVFRDHQRNNCEIERPPAHDYFGDNGTYCRVQRNEGLPYPCPTKEACEIECNRRWPWKDDPSCSHSCEGDVIKRDPEDKPPENAEHCQREIRCTNPCPPTTTTTTTNPPTPAGLEGAPTSGPNKALIGIAGGISLVIIAVIVIVVLIAIRAKNTKKKKKEQLLKAKALARKDDESTASQMSRGKYKHRSMSTGGSKAVQDAMEVSLADEPSIKVGGKSKSAVKSIGVDGKSKNEPSIKVSGKSQNAAKSIGAGAGVDGKSKMSSSAKSPGPKAPMGKK